MFNVKQRHIQVMVTFLDYKSQKPTNKQKTNKQTNRI